MTARATRVGLVALGLLLGACGLSAFVTAVPPREWVRVVIWLGAGVVVHDAILAPLAVVTGFVVIRTAPAARRWATFGALVLAAVLLVLVPLLATGGLRT